MASLMSQKQKAHTVGSKDMFTTVGTISNLLLNLIKGGSVHFSFWGHDIAEKMKKNAYSKAIIIFDPFGTSHEI